LLDVRAEVTLVLSVRHIMGGRARDQNAPPGRSGLKFRGYRRQEGRPGVRSELWVMPSADCGIKWLEAALRDYHRQYWIDSVRILKHPGPDADEAIVSGLVSNPNAAGVLLLSPGHDVSGSRTAGGSAADEYAGGPSRAVRLRSSSPSEIAEYLDRLGGEAPRVREEFPISDLCVGIDLSRGDLCYGPLERRFSDLFAAQG
jgi:altronate hydrolase